MDLSWANFIVGVSRLVLFLETSCGISIFSLLGSSKGSRIAASGKNTISVSSDFK